MIEYPSGKFIKEITDEELLKALKVVRDTPAFQFPELGICAGVEMYYNGQGFIFDSADGQELKHLMSLWPKFSGRAFYPVPSVDPSGSPDGIYHACRDMWNQETEYGKLRWELLEFCIQRLEDRIYEDKVS